MLMCAHEHNDPLYLQSLARWHSASKRKTLVSGTLGYNDRIVTEGNTDCFVIDEGTTGIANGDKNLLKGKASA